MAKAFNSTRPTGAALAHALSNPGLRSKLPASMLTAAQRKQRELNTRLNAPVTAGSSVTNREVARQANTAADVRYGPAAQALTQQLTQAQGTLKDVPNYYDAYQKQISEHTQNVGAANQQANQAIQNLLAGSRGLGPEGAGSTTGNQADQVRAQMLAALGAAVAGQGAASQRQAETFANVVAPGEKIQAITAATKALQALQAKQADLGAQKGAFAQTTRSQLAADEAKNVLATTLATGKAAANTPGAKAAVAGATAEATLAAKHGYSLHAWRMLGPTGRQAAIKEDKGTAADHVYASGPFAGRMKSAVDAMSDAQRQKLVDAYKAKTKTGKPTSGPGSLTPDAEHRVLDQIQKAVALIKSAPASRTTQTIDPTTGKAKTQTVPVTDDMIYRELLAGTSPLGVVDRRVINLAFAQARRGGLSASEVAMAHGLRVHVGGNFKILKRPAPEHP